MKLVRPAVGDARLPQERSSGVDDHEVVPRIPGQRADHRVKAVDHGRDDGEAFGEVIAAEVERKRDEDTLAQRRSAGSYVPRPNRLGIQNWRMAATTVGMSRHASRPKDGVLGPRHCVSRTGRPAGSTQWNKIGSSSPCSMAFGFSNRTTRTAAVS